MCGQYENVPLSSVFLLGCWQWSSGTECGRYYRVKVVQLSV